MPKRSERTDMNQALTENCIARLQEQGYEVKDSGGKTKPYVVRELSSSKLNGNDLYLLADVVERMNQRFTDALHERIATASGTAEWGITPDIRLSAASHIAAYKDALTLIKDLK